MSLITFVAGIGLPAAFKVAYDEESKSLVGGLSESVLSSCFKVISADLKLKVYFSVTGGELCGFVYECGLPDLLPEAELTVSYAPDGFIKKGEHYSLLAPDVNYVIFADIYAKYDKNKKLIMIGNLNEDSSTYKVCENMCVGVDNEGALTGFLIEI